MKLSAKKWRTPGKLPIVLISIGAAIAVFAMTADAGYHPTVTVMGWVTHGTDRVWGAVVTANTTSERGTPTGSGTAVTDSAGFYQIVLDRLDYDAGYVELAANYTDYLGVKYRGVAGGSLSSGVLTTNILITNASERAALATATPVPAPTSIKPTPTPTPVPGGDQGQGGPCGGLLILLPVTAVSLVVGQRIRRQSK